jgi:RNA polymerase sigma-70 factor (ECF subfamily)
MTVQKIDDLLSRYQNLVYHLITRTVFDTSAHQDLFQEVFMQVIQDLPRFEGRSKLSTWISSITLNTCFNHLRKQKRVAGNFSLNQWLEHRGDIPAKNVTLPAENCEREDTKQKLTTALEGMENKYRIPLILFYFEDFSYQQIAETLEMPLGTVKTNLYRGLRALKKSMGGNKNEFL